MTRPKVDPDKRQRTAQACDSCKRRKQKCNGQKPCQTCAKKQLSCLYGSTEDDLDRNEVPSPKRRMVETERMVESPSNKSTNGSLNQSSPYGLLVPSPQTSQTLFAVDDHPPPTGGLQNEASEATGHPLGVFPARTEENKQTANVPNAKSSSVSGAGSVSDEHEEADVYNYTRMLQDPSGRLLYIGDSATLSFLQLIRTIVDHVAGQSDFTQDPQRHRIVENSITLPNNIRRTHLLPDRQTANVLVDAYFTNTNGLLDIFYQRKLFMDNLDACYTDPLRVDPNWLCLLFLVLAIGLVMATPLPGSPEDTVIQKLRGEAADRAEVFYLDATDLKDPSAGFEDAGFWSIQALTLMAVYNLVVSKRNAAYAYFGMAVRSAFALGLHREEAMCIFSPDQQSVRRSLWRSLFVLDRFLAASLGRPTSIRESDCSGTALIVGDSKFAAQAPFSLSGIAASPGPDAIGLQAAVHSCHAIGVILEKVYSQRKISTKLAQEIADECKSWNNHLDPSLNYRRAIPENPAQGIAILHVNLLYCHSIVLLTRPFFLYVMNKIHQDPATYGKRSGRQITKLDKFGEACVTSSTHSIALVQTALENRYLPRRTPFVLYFLFAAGLVVLANEFSGIYRNPGAKTAITDSINIMQHFAQQDPQGTRLLFILSSFRDVVQKQQTARDQQVFGNMQARPQALAHPQPIPAHEVNEFLGNLFTGPNRCPPSASPAARTRSTRNNSTFSNSSGPTNFTSHTSIPRTSSNLSDSRSPVEGLNAVGARRDSLDEFFNLATINNYPDSTGGGSSAHENDSLGDAEIDFQSLWQWPTNGSTGLTPGLGPGMPLASGMEGYSLQMGMQRINDESLFAPSNEFGGH